MMQSIPRVEKRVRLDGGPLGQSPKKRPAPLRSEGGPFPPDWGAFHQNPQSEAEARKYVRFASLHGDHE